MVKKEVTIHLTPNDLAEEFWNMDSAQQADFFNILGGIIEKNLGQGSLQLDYIAFERYLYPYGADLIKKLAERINESGL